jgi:hypothetical protein
MEAVLRSGIFDKAPRLCKFFLYICERYFDGETDRLKEYCIAVEALGRSADFDPKKDSIVRVEAHRLRKRLEQFYAGPGADHAIQILIPNGQYRPRFIPKGAPIAAEPEVAPEVAQPGFAQLEIAEVTLADPQSEEPKRRWSNPRLYAIAALLLLSAGAATLLLLHSRRPVVQNAGVTAAKNVQTASTDDGGQTPVVANEGNDVRFLAGYSGPPFLDNKGHVWSPDNYFSGGNARPIGSDHFVEAQPDTRLVHAQRCGTFRYAIPVNPGTYELHLLFAETEFGRGNPNGGGEATRVFQVSINGKPKLSSFDPLAEAGAPNRLTERVFKGITPDADGKIHLGFEPLTNPAILNGVELLPEGGGRIRPIRLVSQPAAVTDSDGKLWAPDGYVIGGTLAARSNAVRAEEKALFRGERYGNFTYRIPVSPGGKYRVTLYFAEQWFGTGASQFSPVENRSFDVFANRQVLLRNFQPGVSAGGANREIKKVFENVRPDRNGIIHLEFVPVQNYAEVNAIEVVETD